MCGEPIDIHSNVKYCSDECRRVATNIRHKKYTQTHFCQLCGSLCTSKICRGCYEKETHRSEAHRKGNRRTQERYKSRIEGI